MCIYHVRFVFTLTINVYLPYLFCFYFDYQCVFNMLLLFFTLIINVYLPCSFGFYFDYQCVFTMFVWFLL